MRWNGIHQHARRISCLAAGNVNANAVQRRHLLPEQRAIFVAVAPALAAGFLLRFVVAAHAAGRCLQGLALGDRNRFKSSLELGLCQLQCGHRAGLHAVETRRVVQHGGVATLLHVSQDVSHTLLNLGVRLRRPVQTRLELSLEAGAGGGHSGG